MKYMLVHLTYTFPVLIILTLICRPFINRNETFKIVFISTLAFIYTTPWDNYIIYNEAWTYSPDRVLAVIGYVPIEEYMFFVIQTVITLLWTLLCVRWSTPCLNFNYDKQSYQLIRWIPIMFLSIVTAIGYTLMVPTQHTFYLGCILFWVSPVLILMWYGGGNFFVKKITPSTVAILVPTLYLCWVDQICLKNNVWHISEATSINVFIADQLPLEEALFFFITNALIVLGANCYDKARGIIDTYTLEFPRRFSINSAFVGQMFKAFITSEYMLSPIVTEDIKSSIEVLKIASKSFTTASFLFQSGMFIIK